MVVRKTVARKERFMSVLRSSVVWVVLAAVGLAFVMAALVAAVPSEARAHAGEPPVRIIVDGEKVKVIKDNGVFRKRLSPGCHNVRVLRGKSMVRKHGFCAKKASKLRVVVRGHTVRSTVKRIGGNSTVTITQTRR